MGYITKAFFVKPDSTFPEENIDTHFVDRCNYYQGLVGTTEFIMGQLYNSKTNELIQYFSDYTVQEHGMTVNKMVIKDSTVPGFGDPVIPQELVNSVVVPTEGTPTVTIEPSIEFNEILA